VAVCHRDLSQQFFFQALKARDFFLKCVRLDSLLDPDRAEGCTGGNRIQVLQHSFWFVRHLFDYKGTKAVKTDVQRALVSSIEYRRVRRK